jgi:hypothetical protein
VQSKTSASIIGMDQRNAIRMGLAVSKSNSNGLCYRGLRRPTKK